MLTAPTPTLIRPMFSVRLPHPPIFDQALPQPDHARHRNDDGHHPFPAAQAVRQCSGGTAGRDEHAQAHEAVPQHFGVRGEHIGHQDIAEFAIVCVRDAADGDPAEDGERAVPTGVAKFVGSVGSAGEEAPITCGQQEEEEDEEEGAGGEEVPGKNERGAQVGDDPEEEEGDEDWGLEGEREAAGGEGVGGMVLRGACGISNERGYVLVEVMLVDRSVEDGGRRGGHTMPRRERYCRFAPQAHTPCEGLACSSDLTLYREQPT
jgi:hypothetical protein